jgi:hypothetical protein
MDRLAAFYHWNDYESLDQAFLVARCQNIDLAKIQAWSKKEDKLEKHTIFVNKLRLNKGNK